MEDAEAEELRQRVRLLESQLGILRESDGREARLGVTATRVAELRELAVSAPTDAYGEALRDAVRFYDLVRKAWEGANEEYDGLQEQIEDVVGTAWEGANEAYDELRARVDRAITWLVTVNPKLPASIIADRAKLALKALRDNPTSE